MRVKRFNSKKEVLITYKKYLINWENDGASKLEVSFRDFIHPFWKNSIILYQFKIPGSLLRIDFLNVNKRLAVEIDGEQHESFNKHFHANSRNTYLAAIKRDLDKEKWCELNNIKLIRLNVKDLKNLNLRELETKFNINLL